jgi:hypothetical protein
VTGPDVSPWVLSRRGNTVHRAGCPRAKNAVPWRWRDRTENAHIVDDAALWQALGAWADWLQPCRLCIRPKP